MQRDLQVSREVKSPASAIMFSPTGARTDRTCSIATRRRRLGSFAGDVSAALVTLKLTTLAVIRQQVSACRTTLSQAKPHTHRKGEPHDHNDHDPARKDPLDT